MLDFSRGYVYLMLETPKYFINIWVKLKWITVDIKQFFTETLINRIACQTHGILSLSTLSSKTLLSLTEILGHLLALFHLKLLHGQSGV